MNTSISKSDGQFLKTIEALIFIVIINLSYWIGFRVRFHGRFDESFIESFYTILPYLSIAALSVFYVYGVFSMAKKSFSESVLTITLALMIINVLAVVFAFYTRGFDFPRSVFYYFFLAFSGY